MIRSRSTSKNCPMLCCFRSFIDSLADLLSNISPCPNAGVHSFPLLSIVRLRKGHTTSIVASFSDLLLIYSEVPPGLNWNLGPSCSVYFICNPLTKQWITLPRHAFHTQGVTESFWSALYAIHIAVMKSRDVRTTNAHYRYKVVRIHSPTQSNANQLHVQIFSSNTGEWCDSFVSSPRRLNSFSMRSERAGVVNCKGMLHWVDENDGICKGFVVFDPFNDAQQCRYINPPIDFDSKDFVNLGVFQGRFRIYHLIHRHNVCVWELEDYGNAVTWCLIHIVYFKDVVSEHSKLVKMAKGVSPPVSFLAFHPKDYENVFLQFRNYIVLCNMRTRVLKMASHLRHRGQILPASYSGDVVSKYVYILEQPS